MGNKCKTTQMSSTESERVKQTEPASDVRVQPLMRRNGQGTGEFTKAAWKQKLRWGCH